MYRKIKVESLCWGSIWLLSISLFTILIAAPLTQQGMFLDGVIYNAIAKNMSHNLGTLWYPHYTNATFNVFYEHPPLAIGIESLFFRLFGDGWFTEHIYSFFLIFLNWVMFYWYWVVYCNKPFISLSWMLLLWLMIPLNLIYKSNMLECTLTIFTFAAVLFLLPRLSSPTHIYHIKIFRYFVASICLLMAFLSNGPTGLYPLIVPAIYGLTHQYKLKKIFSEMIIFFMMFSIVAIGFFMICPDAVHNISEYFATQLMPSIVGNRNLKYVGLKHFHIFYLLFRSFLPVSLLALGVHYWQKNKCINLKQNASMIIFWLSLALISSLPVGISHRQALNYIMQAGPLYIMAMMHFTYPAVESLIASINRKNTSVILVTTLIIWLSVTGFMISRIGSYARDEALLEDVKELVIYLNKNNINPNERIKVSISTNLYNQFLTEAYFSRFSDNIEVEVNQNNKYYLVQKKNKQDKLPLGYLPILKSLKYYQLAYSNGVRS